MSIKKYDNFRKIQEVRREKKCPVLSFKPIRESETYTDMIGMGWIEVLADNPKGIISFATEEERSHKDRMGNIAFYHPVFKGSRLTNRATRNAEEGYPHFNIKHDGGVRVVEGFGNTAELPRLNTDLRRTCMTVEDYLYKMSFLIKYGIREQGFPVTNEELYSNETYKDLIRRKMKEDPSVVKHFKNVDLPKDPREPRMAGSEKEHRIVTLPPSLKEDDLGKGVDLLKRFGLFGED